MKNRPLSVVALAVCLGTLSALAESPDTPAPTPPTADTPIPLHRSPFAVVELYTSEGCSSCPPAEVLLNQIDRDARQQDTRVFALAFHVDYWNRLGWTDPFSDAAYSRRQRDYARALRQRSVYTPQMIVNGTRGFVGSDARRARNELTAALAPQTSPPPPVGLGFVAEPVGPDRQLKIRWRLDALPSDTTLNLAITENGLSTDVPRGENRGRTLHHDGVVRALLTQALTATDGRWTIPINSEVDLSQASAVLFVQDTTTLAVLAAHRIDLTSATAAP